MLAGLDLDAELGRLTVPTAVLGGRDDRLTPLAHARGLAAALPHCVGLTELTGMGHMTPVEAPEAVTHAIRELTSRYLAGGKVDTSTKAGNIGNVGNAGNAEKEKSA